MDSRRCPNCIRQNITADWCIQLPSPARFGVRRGDHAGSADRSTGGLALHPGAHPPPEVRMTQSSPFNPGSETEHAASPRCLH